MRNKDLQINRAFYTQDQLAVLSTAIQRLVEVEPWIANPDLHDANMQALIGLAVKGYDIEPYADPKMHVNFIHIASQMLDFNIEVTPYINKGLTWEHLQVIALGLTNNIDVSIYADPKWNPDQMGFINDGLMSEINLLERGITPSHSPESMEMYLRIHKFFNIDLPAKYYDSNYTADQLYHIAYGLQKGYDLEDIAGIEIDAPLMSILIRSHDKGVSLKHYLQAGANIDQLQVIGFALENDIELIEEPLNYDAQQLSQICDAQRHGISIEIITPEMSAMEMYQYKIAEYYELDTEAKEIPVPEFSKLIDDTFFYGEIEEELTDEEKEIIDNYKGQEDIPRDIHSDSQLKDNIEVHSNLPEDIREVINTYAERKTEGYSLEDEVRKLLCGFIPLGGHGVTIERVHDIMSPMQRFVGNFQVADIDPNSVLAEASNMFIKLHQMKVHSEDIMSFFQEMIEDIYPISHYMAIFNTADTDAPKTEHFSDYDVPNEVKFQLQVINLDE